MGMLKSRRVMVLNKNWHFLTFVSIKRAFSLICNSYKDGVPKANVLDVSNNYKVYPWEEWAKLEPITDDEKIITPKRNYKIPEIIILTRQDKIYSRQLKLSRRTIYRRDFFHCQYCGKKFAPDKLSVDHVLAKCHGGKNVWTNMVACCLPCNTKKGHKSLEEAGMKLLSIPRKPKTNLFTSDFVHVCESWRQFLPEEELGG